MLKQVEDLHHLRPGGLLTGSTPPRMMDPPIPGTVPDLAGGNPLFTPRQQARSLVQPLLKGSSSDESCPPPPPPAESSPLVAESLLTRSTLPPPPMPDDVEMVRNIEVLAAFVVKNGPEFELMAQTRKAEDPKFAFMFGGDPGTEAAVGYEFYKWKKQSLQLQKHGQAGPDGSERKPIQLESCRLVQHIASKEVPSSPLIFKTDMTDGQGMTGRLMENSCRGNNGSSDVGQPSGLNGASSVEIKENGMEDGFCGVSRGRIPEPLHWNSEPPEKIGSINRGDSPKASVRERELSTAISSYSNSFNDYTTLVKKTGGSSPGHSGSNAGVQDREETVNEFGKRVRGEALKGDSVDDPHASNRRFCTSVLERAHDPESDDDLPASKRRSFYQSRIRSPQRRGKQSSSHSRCGLGRSRSHSLSPRRRGQTRTLSQDLRWEGTQTGDHEYLDREMRGDLHLESGGTSTRWASRKMARGWKETGPQYQKDKDSIDGTSSVVLVAEEKRSVQGMQTTSELQDGHDSRPMILKEEEKSSPSDVGANEEPKVSKSKAVEEEKIGEKVDSVETTSTCLQSSLKESRSLQQSLFTAQTSDNAKSSGSSGVQSKRADEKSAEMAVNAGNGGVENVSPPDDDQNWSPGQPVEGATGVGEVETGQEEAEARAKLSKEGRGLKLLRSAVAEYVKEVLKPTWKGGHMSKDAYKAIVKKAVDKVSGTLQTHQIPKSQENVDQYMALSRTKIAKLVQGYVDKFMKTECSTHIEPLKN